tara:strand:+ start:2083 stop:2319 length:237 start_codon:yes stop_codon:yes gene_type:complete
MKQISDEDLKWLIESTLEILWVQYDEYGNKPKPDEVDRILRLAEINGIALTEDNYGEWIKGKDTMTRKQHGKSTRHGN